MKSRVHPTYKTQYHVQHWAASDRALVCRGDITIGLSPAAIAAWDPDGAGPRGAPRKYSDLAIESALTLRLLFHLPLRQTAGCLTALCVLRGLDLRSPDHTTLSRRGQHLDRRRRGVPRRAGLHLLIDSTGRSMAGAGEWATAKHGGRGTRGWKTLPVGVDHTGVIVAHARTDATGDDAPTGVELIEAVNDDIASVTADAADDTVGFYDAAGARGATVVVPPTKTARVSRRRPRASARDHTSNTVKSIGRRRWKKTSRDQQHARVENAFFRYTSIIGDGSAGQVSCATKNSGLPDRTSKSGYATARLQKLVIWFLRTREAVRPTPRFLDPHDPSFASRPHAMLAYNPEKEYMTEDEREHLLSTVGQAHAGLSEVALKLRLGLPPKTPALKTAIKAERVAFDLKRLLQRLEVKDVETITRRAPVLPEVRRGGKIVDPESLLRHENRHDELLTGLPRRNNPRRSG